SASPNGRNWEAGLHRPGLLPAQEHMPAPEGPRVARYSARVGPSWNALAWRGLSAPAQTGAQSACAVPFRPARAFAEARHGSTSIECALALAPVTLDRVHVVVRETEM